MAQTDDSAAPALSPDEPVSSFERQRGRPMRGCIRLVGWGAVALLALLLLLVGGGYYYTGTERFALLVKARIERTLEWKLGRDVTIREVIVHRRQGRIILRDIAIANTPGARREYFATVKEVEIAGGIESFRTRTIRLGRIDVRGASLNVEIFPEGSPLRHNFPSWRRSEPRAFQIARVEADKIWITGAAVELLDHRHDLHIVAAKIDSELTPTIQKGLYAGTATSPSVMLRLKDYQPVALTMSTSYDYRPGSLRIGRTTFAGRGIELVASGVIEPLTEAVYDFRLAAKTELARVREVFEVERALEGSLAFDGRIRGEKGTFNLTGDFRVPELLADAYELAAMKGSVDATQERVRAHIDSAAYGGGTLTGDYELAQLREPYPMSIDLRFLGVSLEKLFEDWDVEETGLRGRATGTLAYAWNKDDILGGHGEGDARLAPGAVAFGNARYPMPVSGRTRFTLDEGVIRFAPSELQTPKSRVAFRGTLRIEDLDADLAVDIRSEDFRELDRVAFNFAQGLEETDFEMLGLAGAGRVEGTVRGPLQEPRVAAKVTASQLRFSDVLLGASDIDLRYDGPTSTVHFEPAVFRRDGGSVSLRGTLTFPESGPTPRFDLVADVDNYDVETILDLINLDLVLGGRGTGRLAVAGTPDAGEADFREVTVVRNGRRLDLNGQIAWTPGEGNVRFNLDIGAESMPVSEVLAFLELGEFPITGELTGTLHVEGQKSKLEGAGAVTVRNGTIFGEPIDVARADLEFHEGVMTARAIEIHAPAGVIRGEATVDMTAETFSYELQPTEIDLSKVKALAGLADLFAGRVRLVSRGAGSFDRPDILLEVNLLEGARFRGRPLPEGEQPRLYIAMSNGQLRITATAWDALQVQGEGLVAESGALTGHVTATIPEFQKLIQLIAAGTPIEATGSAVIELELGGSIASLDALRITGTVPQLDLAISGNRIQPLEPIRFALANGRVEFESFRLQTEGALFSVAGGVGLTGSKALDLTIDGQVEAALFQLFMPDARVEGELAVKDLTIRGTLEHPVIDGSAEMQGGELKLPGFQLISDIRASLIFSSDHLEIDSLRATLGGGQITAAGRVGLDGLRPTTFTMHMEGTGVALRYFEGVALDGNFDLNLGGSPERASLAGTIVVNRAVYFKDFDLTTAALNFLLETRRVIGPEIAASWQERVSLDIKICGPGSEGGVCRPVDTLAVKNNIADVTATAQLEVRGTLAAPNVIGDVVLDEGGTIEFQDIEYRVARGTINFQNPFRLDPYFDITAEARRGEYDLTINLTGTLERITPTLTSDPPTSDLTLLSLLSPQFADPTSTDARRLDLQNVGAAGGSLLLQSLGGFVGTRVFPFVDAFRFDVGALTELADPKVTFEKRVSDDVRAIVVYFLNSRENIEIVEWQVTPDWLLQFVRDSKLEADFIVDSVEGRFRRRYTGHWFSRQGDDFVVAAPRPAVAALPPPAPTPETVAVEPLTTTTVQPIVASIGFAADSAVNPERLGELVAGIRVGEPLRLSDLQAAIKALYGTGEFGDIQVDAAPAASGAVAIRFLLFVRYRVGDISFEGLPIDDSRFDERLAIDEEDTLSLNAIERSAAEIVTELRRRGYLEAVADPEVEYFRAENRANVIFHIEAGPLAHVAAVEFCRAAEGESECVPGEGVTAPFPETELMNQMRLEPGDPFNATEGRSDADRIESHLVKKGYRQATVRSLEPAYDDATDTVRLRYAVVVGPPVRVAVEGVPRRSVRRLLPLRGDEPYTADAIERAREDIRRLLQRRGYYFASVEVEEARVGEEYVVTYRIDPGKRYELASLEFDGNRILEDDELREAVTTAPEAGWRTFLRNLFRRPGGVNEETLAEDVESLETLYRVEGFANASIGRPIVTAIAADQLQVTFPVVEGPRTLVGEVRVEGVERFERESLPDLVLEPGDPLNPMKVLEDRLALLTFYGNRGHVEAQVAPRFEFNDDRTSAIVTYSITEGPGAEIKEVVVRGNTYTDAEVIDRQAKIDEGEPFSYTTLLAAQRELYRLGIFQRVDVHADESAASAGDRTVVIDVEEGKTLSVGGSVGYSEERGAGASFSLSHRNLFGTARFLGLEARKFEREERFLLNYREPFIGKWDIPVQITAFRSEEERSGRHFERLGTFVEASRVLGETVRWSTRYEYRRVDCTELLDAEDLVPCGDPSSPIEEREVQISSVTPNVFWDRRDDPLNPFRGMFASASLEYAFPLFSAETTFLKGFAQGAWYRPLSERSTLAVSARVGLTEKLKTAGPGSVVPFPERFTAGGESSHRAFGLDELGILCIDEGPDCQPTLIRTDEGNIYPLGGNALVLANVEYRFPIFGSLQGAVFADAGNIWREIDLIDASEVRYGAGVGLRYLTPVGPIRLDIGWKIDRKPWEDPYANFLTIGFAY